jgi:hypothetical protein
VGHAAVVRDSAIEPLRHRHPQIQRFGASAPSCVIWLLRPRTTGADHHPPRRPLLPAARSDPPPPWPRPPTQAPSAPRGGLGPPTALARTDRRRTPTTAYAHSSRRYTDRRPSPDQGARQPEPTPSTQAAGPQPAHRPARAPVPRHRLAPTAPSAPTPSRGGPPGPPPTARGPRCRSGGHGLRQPVPPPPTPTPARRRGGVRGTVRRDTGRASRGPPPIASSR